MSKPEIQSIPTKMWVELAGGIPKVIGALVRLAVKKNYIECNIEPSLNDEKKPKVCDLHSIPTAFPIGQASNYKF